MIEITPLIHIDEREIHFDFVHASGPGGQNVNKVASAVQLRFDVHNSSTLPEEVKARLQQLAGKRMTVEGVLVIEAKRFRTQERNKEDATLRLIALVKKALVKPRPRKKTRPSASAIESRIERKKRRGTIKRARRNPPDVFG